MDLMRLVVFAVLAAIVFSLGSALFHLSTGKGDSGKMVRALTIRVGLSMLLFLLLMGAWKLGYIHPHAVGY
jgi:hypothetical protein